MKMDPFIEAEEAAGRSVAHCCDMFQVSKSAYYQRRRAIPSVRDVTDAELTEKIREIHAESDGTYGSPRVYQELRHRGVHVGRRRVTRLMRLAGLEGRCKRRWRRTTIQDPAPGEYRVTWPGPWRPRSVAKRYEHGSMPRMPTMDRFRPRS